MILQRHDLVVLSPQTKIHAHTFGFNENILQQRLLHRGCWVVVRQPQKGSYLRLGFPHVDECTKQKYRFSVDVLPQDILATQSLPRLADIFPKITSLSLSNIYVYGSYAWQYLTGLSYVSENSDIDLLIHYDGLSLNEINRILIKVQQTIVQCNIDGEVRFDGYGDCSIHELLDQAATQILFKCYDRVQLIPRATLYAVFPTLLG